MDCQVCISLKINPAIRSLFVKNNIALYLTVFVNFKESRKTQSQLYISSFYFTLLYTFLSLFTIKDMVLRVSFAT